MDSITDIIEISHNDTVDAKKSILKLITEIKRYQQKTKNYIDANYTEFLINLSSNEIYLAEGEKLIKEVENILQTIENDTKSDLYTATEELKSYVEELNEITIGLQLSYKLLKIDNFFEMLEESKNNNEYLDVMDYLSKIKCLTQDKNDNKLLQRLDCYQNIKIKYHIESEMLLHNLKQRFEQLVQFNEKLFQNTKSIIIKITKNTNELNKIIQALFNAKYNPKKLCDFLLENVFKPIIQKPVSIQIMGANIGNSSTDMMDNVDDDNDNDKDDGSGKIDSHKDKKKEDTNTNIQFNTTDTDDNFLQLFLSFSLKDLGEDLRPNYKIVFLNIKLIIKFLNYMNVKISDNLYALQIFGDIMKENLIKLIINECLLYSIPDTIDEMNKSTLIDDIHKFDKFLKKIRILNSNEDMDLIKYSGKIEILFRNQFCTNILDKSIEIMKKDLHDMMLVSPDDNSGTSTTNQQNNSMVSSSDTTENPLIFPRCMISKNTIELIDLMENVLRQITQSDDKTISERLLSTIPIILTHYLDDIPAYHEKLLQNIPQQSALFHNNCQYLAYWLKKNYNKNIESIDKFVIDLQNLGNEHFKNQIKNQQSQLFEILKGFDLTDSISELGVGQQKTIRQCLRQLDLLKNVWQTILPDKVYNKTMCNLLNDFCTEIIKKILSVEDLSASVADGLSEICSIIIERAPTLFQDKLQVYEVKTWMKLKQLNMILSASLLEITEEWSEGKGPLTLNFKAEEIRHLIRALFQNTDRRAKALTSIV